MVLLMSGDDDDDDDALHPIPPPHPRPPPFAPSFDDYTDTKLPPSRLTRPFAFPIPFSTKPVRPHGQRMYATRLVINARGI
jgi:hypothetical protein